MRTMWTVYDIDTDECESNNGGCNQICNNTAGSYQCLCSQGYLLSADNHKCKGINSQSAWSSV